MSAGRTRARLAAAVTLAATHAVAWGVTERAARADEKEEVATESFKRASEAYAHKEYRAAALAFEAAHQVLPAGATIYNAALSWLAAGEDLRAARDLKEAVTIGGLDPGQSADARERLAVVDRRLGHVEVIAPSGASVAIDGRDPAATPVKTRVAPGVHQLRATLADGTSVSRTVTIAAGATERVDFNALPQAPPSPVAPVAPEAPDKAAPGGGNTQRTLGWVGIASGAALSGLAIGLGAVGYGALQDFESNPSSQALHDKAVSFRTGEAVAWVGAGVVGITGVVLLLTSHGSSSHAEPSAGGRAATVSIGPTGAWVSGRF
jgi:hypothetical protein